MCMQGWDTVPTALIVVLGALDVVGKGMNRVTRRGKRERMKQRINRLADKVTPRIPDETEKQLKQLQKLQEENKGTEQATFFGIQMAVIYYYVQNNADAAMVQINETLQFLEGLKHENRITFKGHKTLLFAYYLAASIANDDCKYNEALKNFDCAVQQCMTLESTPTNQTTPWSVHAFENRDFHKPRKCAVCDKTLFGTSRHGLECKVCGCIVHPKCVLDVVAPCVFDANNNQTTGFEGLVSANISLISLLNSRGLAYYYGGQYDKALSDFDAVIDAVKKNQNNPNTEEGVNLGMYYANRALVNFYKKNLEAAVNDATTAIAQGFVNAQVYTIRASSLQLLGRSEEALVDRNKARECDPSAPLEVFPFELPMELIIAVFSYLKNQDLSKAARTCKLWKQIIYDHTELGVHNKYGTHN